MDSKASYLQLFKCGFLFAPGTFHPSLDTIFFNMIRYFSPLNPLTTACYAVNLSILAICHVILETQPNDGESHSADKRHFDYDCLTEIQIMLLVNSSV